MLTFFLIVFFVLFAVQIMGLILYQIQKNNAPIMSVACAGSEKFDTPRELRITNLDASDFKGEDGSVIDSRDYERYITVGNSMLLGGIRDKDVIFVKKGIDLTECTFPIILVLRREPAAMEKASSQYDDKAELKIRRTWKTCTLSQSDEDIVNMVGEIIESNKFQEIRQLDTSKFLTPDWMKDDVRCRISRYRAEHIGCEDAENENNAALLSTTYDTEQGRVHFSIHPKRTIVGEVKYAFGTNE